MKNLSFIITLWAGLTAFSLGMFGGCDAAHAQAPEPIRILAWNIESGGSDTNVIIRQLLIEMPKFDVVALSELPSGYIKKIADALKWKSFAGSRGGSDRLMFAWSDRFETGTQIELREHGGVELATTVRQSSWS